MLKKYGPYGPQGPWTMGPTGPRGLGPKLRNFEKNENLPKDAPKDLLRPLGHIPDGPKKV